jgi:P pilus assembly chaperone PapD
MFGVLALTAVPADASSGPSMQVQPGPATAATVAIIKSNGEAVYSPKKVSGPVTTATSSSTCTANTQTFTLENTSGKSQTLTIGGKVLGKLGNKMDAYICLTPAGSYKMGLRSNKAARLKVTVES